MGGTAARYVSGQGVENQLGPGCEDLARRWICFPTLLQRNFLELPDGSLSGLQHAYLAGSPLWEKPNSNCPPAAPEGWYCKYYVYPPPRDVVNWLNWLDWAPVWRFDHWCFDMGRDGPRSQSLQDQTRPRLVRRHDGLMNSVWASPSSSLHSSDEPR